MTDERLSSQNGDLMALELNGDYAARAAQPDRHLLATHLLDREAPDDYRQEWTARIAAPPDALSVGTDSVVIFRLGNEWLSLPTAVFQEVAEPSAIHAVPHRRRGALLGLVNVRGELLLCVALAVVLNLEQEKPHVAAGHTIYRRLLVVNKQGSRMAFPVDEVFGVHRYHPRDLLEVPATLAKTAATYATGMLSWRDKTVGCLDEGALFSALNRSFS